ncbi:MAG: ribonuclease D [Gammaproteobacteria bacterium HGW-Gammaproteobacteria-3]|nr:MAG: ribonuclease D [Gammaproteobacteria bacterium HGW-Gammaproteobacteria-3]
MTTIQYIDTPEKLAALCEQIAQESWLALDTEFLREKTYYPKFCLLQIATPAWVACIDPLALENLSPLFEVLYNTKITKVFHSSRQDLEIFYQLTGKIPTPVFDTQIAAPLLGFQDNPGYAMLVSSLLNINLSKAHTRADWTARPLSEAQLQYAADDVIYLCRIYQIMLEKLARLKRLDWLTHDFAALENPALYDISPDTAWLKIRGKNKLTGKQLAIVQALAQWREATAQKEDRPRNWLLRDDLILELAKLQPVDMNELAAVRSINERTLLRYGRTLCRLISEARQRPPIALKDQGRAAKKTQQQEAVLDILTALVRIRADENSLNPSILADRKDLELLLFEDPESLLLQGWRFSMAGQELLGLLKGEQLLGIQGDKVVSIERPKL